MPESAEDTGEDVSIYLGSILKDLGFVDSAQILEALDLQSREDRAGLRHRLLGEILVSLGYLSQAQLDQGLRRLELLTFGEVLRKQALLPEEGLKGLLDDPRGLMGGLEWLGGELVSRGYIDQAHLDRLLGRAEPAGIFLGDFLRTNGFATADQILFCVDLQQKDRRKEQRPRPLGKLLVENGFITQAQLDEALSFHISTASQPASKAPEKRPAAPPAPGRRAAAAAGGPRKTVRVRLRVQGFDMPLGGSVDLAGHTNLAELLTDTHARFIRVVDLSGPDGPVAYLNIDAVETVRPEEEAEAWKARASPSPRDSSP